MNHIMDGIGHLGNSLAAQTSHGDAAIGHHVNVVLPNQSLTLGLGETGVREHAYLIDDVLPRPRRAIVLDCIVQLLSHTLNAVRHLT